MRKKVPEIDRDVKEISELNQDFFLEGLATYLREFLKQAFRKTIEQELTEFLGYESYARGGRRSNYRNGYYRRDLVTRFGPLEDLAVARDRAGEFQTRILNRYQRRENKIDQQIMALFLGGISTRRMKKITRMLLGRGYSAGTVSRINKELTEAMKEWLQAPLADDIVYLFVDGLNLPVRRFVVSQESLLVAIGINREGHKRFLGVQLGNRESAASWREFFKELQRRGLKGAGLKLGIMDGLPGLEAAFLEAFPKAQAQRCLVHKLRNIAAKLPRKIQKDCLAHCKRIFYADSRVEAEQRFQDWKAHWTRIAPGAVECLEKDWESVLCFYLFPKSHWVRIRTTNLIERAFKEFRRRTRQMDSLPNEECCLRCVYAIAQEMDERWQKRRLPGFPVLLQAQPTKEVNAMAAA